jgi:hypothetical protein
MESKEKCEIHNLALQLMQVPVSYGLPFRDQDLQEARRTLFPHSKMNVLGGCIAESMGRYAEALVCAKCREAEAAWRKDNHREKKFRSLEI